MNRSKFTRIGALVLVFLLVAMYVVTLILAFMKDPAAHRLFEGAIVATVGVPVVLYAYMLMYRYLKGRNEAHSEKPDDQTKDQTDDHID